MKKLSLPVIVCALILSLFFTAAAYGRDVGIRNERRVIMIVVNAISVADLKTAELPKIRASLNSRAALGLMNARAAKLSSNSASGYLSLGAGARANAGRFGSLAIDKGEKILFSGVPQRLSFRGTGRVGSPSYPEMSRLATKLSYQATPGTLGDLLRNGDIKTAVFGNADSLGAYHREINLITMDVHGSTENGTVSKPIETPAEAMAAVRRGLRTSRFVVVEYAPTAIIDSRRDFLTDQAIAGQRRHRLEDVDRLFGALEETYLDGKTMIVLATPSPPSALANAGALQTPLIIAGRGYRGILASSGTRWPGVINNSDVAPTVLSFFNLKIPTYLPGRALSSNPVADPIETINRIADKAMANSAARSTLLSGYITAVVLTIIGALIVLLLWPRASAVIQLQPFLLSLMYVPVVMLLTNALGYSSAWLPLAINPVISLTAGWLTWMVRRSDPFFALAAVSMTTVTVLLAQLPFGSFLERNSVMGMNSIIGARFYGIGNEYAGVLLAAAVVAFATALSLRQGPPAVHTGRAAVILFLALTAIIGLPTLGANVGGAIAAVATGIILTLLLRGHHLQVRHAAYILIAIVIAVSAILFVDNLTSSQSHAVRAASLIRGGGPNQALVIISRKLATNFKLLIHSSWTNILAVAAVLAIGLRLGLEQTLDATKRDYPSMLIGFKTIVLGSIAALIFNDSGVVAAAIMVMFATLSWLYLVIGEAQKTEPSAPLRLPQTDVPDA